jgi:hypothetical protein
VQRTSRSCAKGSGPDSRCRCVKLVEGGNESPWPVLELGRVEVVHGGSSLD